MNEYRYPKSLYANLAVRLIYGEGSRHLEQFSSYNIVPQRNSGRIRYYEIEDPTFGVGANSCARHVDFGNGHLVVSGVTQGNGINASVLLKSPDMSVIDVLFSVHEYDYFEHNWDDQVQYKVDVTAKMLRAVDTCDKSVFPVLVADFPNIVRYLMEHHARIPERDPL